MGIIQPPSAARGLRYRKYAFVTSLVAWRSVHVGYPRKGLPPPSVCLSATMRTSPSPVARSGPNFQGWSVPCQLTFISGTGPVGQGSAEKRAGNSNFIGGFTIEAPVCVRVSAVAGDQVLPGVTRCCQVVTRCCQVVTRCCQV